MSFDIWPANLCFRERLADLCAGPFIGTVRDSFDYTLAPTVNAYLKAESIEGPDRPAHWGTIEPLKGVSA